MANVTYEWYADAFFGGAIPSPEAFLGVITEAEAYIENITRGRTTEATEAVKDEVTAEEQA